MKDVNKEFEILSPINQLTFFGYKRYFDIFLKLFKAGKLPNCILLSGPQGIGKSTFVYHFINYIFSINEDNKYLIDKFTIDRNNASYKLVNSFTHPNFFLIQNVTDTNEIKIQQSRDLLTFLSKSTYAKDLKIVFIDKVENLNLNASNALLKAIEEPNKNTFFLMTHDASKYISRTLQSRCFKYRVNFSTNEKKDIFINLINQHQLDFDINELNENFYLDSPGNIIKCLLILKNKKGNILNNNFECVNFLSEMYQSEKKKKNDTLTLLSFFIEKFYRDLSLSKFEYSYNYYLNYINILKNINNMKRFNLSDKNILLYIKNILINEQR